MVIAKPNCTRYTDRLTLLCEASHTDEKRPGCSSTVQAFSCQGNDDTQVSIKEPDEVTKKYLDDTLAAQLSAKGCPVPEAFEYSVTQIVPSQGEFTGKYMVEEGMVSNCLRPGATRDLSEAHRLEMKCKCMHDMEHEGEVVRDFNKEFTAELLTCDPSSMAASKADADMRKAVMYNAEQNGFVIHDSKHMACKSFLKGP